MSSQAAAWAGQQTAGGPLNKLVLVVMGDNADMADTYASGVEHLVKVTEATPAEVHQALTELEARGLIRRVADGLQLMLD